MKIFFPIFVTVFFVAECMAGSTRFDTNNERSCYHRGDKNDDWYYCGYQTKSCNNKEPGKKAVLHDIRNHGDFFSRGSCTGGDCPLRYFICCGGTNSRSGSFKEVTAEQYDNRSKENDESVTLQVNGGTCTYTKKTHAICGDVTSDPKCTEATDCNAGFILRHGKCLPDCTDGKGFDGQDSDTCVDCARTTSQGTMYNSVKADGRDIGTVCIKCHPDTQLFKEGTGCISLDQASAKYTNHEFQLCWKCANNNTRLEECIDASHTSMGAADAYVKQNCLLTGVSQASTETNAMSVAEPIR